MAELGLASRIISIAALGVEFIKAARVSSQSSGYWRFVSTSREDCTISSAALRITTISPECVNSLLRIVRSPFAQFVTNTQEVP